MFEWLSSRPKLVFTALPFVAFLLIFANLRTLGSPAIGLVALVVYLIVNGQILGRLFFDHERPFFRLVLGLFSFIVVLSLAGVVAAFVYPTVLWYLAGLAFGAAFCSFLNLLFVKYETPSSKLSGKFGGFKIGLHYTYVIYGAYVALLAWSAIILLGSRSGWVRGPIWNVIPTTFLYVYFAATAVLVGITFFSDKTYSKLLLLLVHSMFSLMFIFIVSYPGIIFYDPWYDLGRARTVLSLTSLVKQLFPTGSVEPFWVSEGTLTFIRLLNTYLRGVTEHSLIAVFAGAINVDMYWTYVFLLPVLWGFFVPLITYRLAEIIGMSKNVSILAALLTISNLQFLAWGKLTEATSLGVLFFFLFFYILVFSVSSKMSRRLFLLLSIILLAMLATHFVPALVAISFFVLAFAFKQYERFKAKHLWLGNSLLLMSFLASLFLLPSLVIFRGVLLPMIGTSSFSVNKLLGTSVWSLVFGMSEEMPVFNAVLYEIFPFWA